MTTLPHVAVTRRSSLAIAITPRVALTILVTASAVIRFALVLGRDVQRYLPDEYLYGQLARSLSEGRGAGVLGVPGGTPALLQPLLTAPAWLAGDPELAYRLTQGLNVIAMSLGAVVVYAIARALSVGTWTSVAAAGVALASPGLLYTGYVTADAVAYPLALLAVLAAVRALERPSRGSEALFLGAAGLATFARIQYAALFIAAALAAAVVERGRPGAVLKRHGLLVGAPLAGAAVAVAVGGLGRYESVTSFDVSAESARWVPISAVLLAVAAGVIVVPGALAWTMSQLLRPTSTARGAFAAVSATLLVVLLVASALMAGATGSDRFLERYLVLGIPLAAVAFCCWTAEGRPLRNVAFAVSAIVVGIVAREPISQYVAGQGSADSPLLLAVGRLEGVLGVGGAGLVLALAATAAAGLAIATAFGRIGTLTALLCTAVLLAVVSLGAHAADRQRSAVVVRTMLGGTPNWVDRAGGRDVLLVEPSPAFPSAAMLTALRNISVTGIALLGRDAEAFDGAARRFSVDERGVLRLGGETLHRQLLIDAASARIVVANGRTTAQAGDFRLVTPTGRARLAVMVEGMFPDGWLAGAGSLTLYATGRPGVCRHATLRLALPRHASPISMTIATGSGRRILRLAPGATRVVPIEGSALRRTTLTFTGAPARLLSTPSIRTVSVQSVLSTGIGPCSPHGV